MPVNVSRISIVLFFAASAVLSIVAQTRITPQVPSPDHLVSPEVRPDNRVTFRFCDPNAKEVLLNLEGTKPVAMSKDAEGLWSYTTDPLQPDFYGYSFAQDGVELIDPANQVIRPNLLHVESEVHVPGPSSLPWERNPVPHGEIHHHFYRSAIVGDDRDFYVYTPAGYDPQSKQAYPVLYLLHGFSDDATGWASVGRANVVLDNLIALGKAVPMIVVMPLGYGAPEILARGYAGFEDDHLRFRNFAKFRDVLLSEVVPQVENAYQVRQDRNSRAIAGLSMGGSESLLTGLNTLEQFAWVGAFSPGGLTENFDTEFPGLDSKVNSKIRLLWIACGTEDHFIGINHELWQWLASKGVSYKRVETAGEHTWMVWLRNLADFLPLLFH